VLEPLKPSEVSNCKPEDELDGEACGVCDNCVHPPEVVESARELREQALASERQEQPARAVDTFAQGDRVRVRRYGVGEVELVSGERVAVRFADDSTRTFIARYVKRVPQ
jgi:ATP-dependent DNA helicase RecQ